MLFGEKISTGIQYFGFYCIFIDIFLINC